MIHEPRSAQEALNTLWLLFAVGLVAAALCAWIWERQHSFYSRSRRRKKEKKIPREKFIAPPLFPADQPKRYRIESAMDVDALLDNRKDKPRDP